MCKLQKAQPGEKDKSIGLKGGEKRKKGVHIREFEAEVCRWKQNKDS